MGAAMIEVTVSEARDNLADLLGKVQHGHEDVTIKKHGKAVAVMISVEAMEYYERLEDAELAREVAAIYADPGYDPNDTTPAEEFFAQLRLEDTAE
jgi:prevent-host-death family protein